MSTPVVVVRPPRMPHEPDIHVTPATIGQWRGWCWKVYSTDGRLVGYGVYRTPEEDAWRRSQAAVSFKR